MNYSILNTQYSIRILAVFLLVLGVFSAPAQAEVRLKVAVVNPSRTLSQVAPVRFDLPRGIGPEQIIDIGAMELMYDLEAQSYYVYQKVELEPGEKMTLEVELKDIWLIPFEDLKFLEAHSRELLNKIEGTKHQEVGIKLFTKILSRLKRIAQAQSDLGLRAKAKINLYYENIQVVNEIKADIGMFENLVLDIGGIVEERVEVPETLAISLDEEKAGLGPEDIVELKVKISNPSKKRKQIAPVKYFLPGNPGEVTPRYILNAGGLDVAYDFNKERFYVYKDAVELEPSQVKVFTIEIKDVWKISELELSALRSHTNNLILLLKGTEYYSQAKPLAGKVYFNLDQIIRYQNLKVEAGEHIAYYRTNTLALEDAKRLVAQLEKLISQSGSSPGVTIEQAEKIEGGGPEVKRVRGYEGVLLIARSIFKGKAPTPATTWKIIFTILGFIVIVAGVFFRLWYRQVKKRENLFPEPEVESQGEKKNEK